MPPYVRAKSIGGFDHQRKKRIDNDTAPRLLPSDTTPAYERLTGEVGRNTLRSQVLPREANLWRIRVR
jgi:hypothetical protein